MSVGAALPGQGDVVLDRRGVVDRSDVEGLRRVDAVLRLPGASAGSDEMVALARARGAAVYTSVDEVPAVTR